MHSKGQAPKSTLSDQRAPDWVSATPLRVRKAATWLDEDDHDRWREACQARRVTQQGMLRALTEWVVEQHGAARPTPLFRQLIERAQALDHER